MSTKIADCLGDLDCDDIGITQFYGGVERGIRLQLTQAGKWIEVGLSQAEELGYLITEWAQAQRKEGR